MDLDRESSWRKSSFSGNSGCVEVSLRRADGTFLVRSTKDRSGPVVAFTAHEWAVFLAGVRNGEFDAAAFDA